jgi:TM2 domain-containing membrane protein YozV
MADPFMEVVKGRYKVSEGLSSAKFWSKMASNEVGAGVPRPDINMGWLTVFSFFALDHFYLRSPQTGLLKLLTAGGFGLWWLWDIVQLYGETERVLQYGLSTPFDYVTGIGQGMIYKTPANNAKWQYHQENSMGIWIMCLLIGFTGADMFAMGDNWRGILKLVLFLCSISVIAGLSSYISNGVGTDGLAGFTISVLFLSIILMMIGGVWAFNLYRILGDPDDIVNKGLPNPSLTVSMFSFMEYTLVDKEQVPIGSDKWLQKNKGAGPDVIKQAKQKYETWKIVNDLLLFNKKGITKEQIEKSFAIHGPVNQQDVKVGGNIDDHPDANPVAALGTDIVKDVYNFVADIFKSVGTSLAMSTPWGAAAETARLTLEATKGQITAGLTGVVTQAKDMVPTGITEVVTQTMNRVTPAQIPTQIHAQAQTPSQAQVPTQAGGGAPLSTEGQILGASVIALLAGGLLKGTIDYLL